MDGYMSHETLSWDNYNEGKDLQKQAEAYHLLFGHYPELVQAAVERLIRFAQPMRTEPGVTDISHVSYPLHSIFCIPVREDQGF